MDDLEEYSRYEHDDKIKFMMPSMIEDYKQLLKERENLKALNLYALHQVIKLPTSSYRIPIFNTKYFRVIVFITW